MNKIQNSEIATWENLQFATKFSQEDIDLMKDLGMDAYRFSISWSRIYPSEISPLQRTLFHPYPLIKVSFIWQ